MLALPPPGKISADAHATGHAFSHSPMIVVVKKQRKTTFVEKFGVGTGHKGATPLLLGHGTSELT